MVSIQGYNTYLNSDLFWSSGSTANLSLNSAKLLSALSAYKSPSLLKGFTDSQVSSSQQSGQVTQQVSTAWNSFNSLNVLAKTFTAKDNTNIFNKRAVTSSINAAVTGTAAGGATLASYSVGIGQLANAQQNSGTALLSNGANLSGNVTTTSTYSFNLTTNSGTQQTYYVNVKSGDKNQTVLQKMANTINAAKASGNGKVQAQVVTTTTGDSQYSKLVVNAANTGTDNGFTLNDMTGNLAAMTGVGSAQGGPAVVPTVVAQNSNYTINGVAYTNQSNTVKIDNGNVNLTLAKTTPQAATVTVGQDVAGISKQMESFVQQYNTTVSALQNSGLAVAPKLVSRLAKSGSSAANSLGDIGLSMSAGQTLMLDKADFEQALTTNNGKRIKSLLTGYNGLISEVQNVTKSVTWLPPSWLANTQSSFADKYSSQSKQYVQNTIFGLLYGSKGNLLNIAV